MKNTALLMILALIICAAPGLFAADKYEFKALITKGEVLCQKNGAGGWSKVASGSQFTQKDKVKLASGAYLGLTYNQGGTCEFKNPGIYALKDIVGKMAAMSNNIPEEFLKYVADELGKADDMTKKQKQQLSSSTGAVTRDVDKSKAKPKAINLLYPRKTGVLEPTLNIKWEQTAGVDGYEFYLYDKDSRELLVRKTSYAELTINLKDLNLKPDTYYYWNVKADNNQSVKSDDACFFLLSEEKLGELHDTLKMIRREFGNGEDTPMVQLISAKLYEKNHLMIEAEKQYKTLIDSEPQVKEYKIYYDNFKEKCNSPE